MEDLQFQSNLYIQQHQKNIKRAATEELCQFLGLQFLFSYHRLPCKHQYWSSGTDFAVPVIQQTMIRNGFDKILGNLHVIDNSAKPGKNKGKLYKLRP